MIVDYGWVQILLNGNLNFNQYNANNNFTDTSNTGRIAYIDLAFNIVSTLNYPYFVLSDVEDPTNGGNYFTYSTNPNGPFTNTLTIDLDAIPVNGTVRVYVKVVDNYNETKHVKTRMVFTPAGNWKPPTWTSSVFGYDLYALPADVMTLRYYDWQGNERVANDINNYHIGWIDIIISGLPFSFPGASFNISDAEPGSNGGNYFQYSFTNGSGYTDNLTWSPGLVTNGSAVRVYVQFNDNNTGWRRVTSQLVINGVIANQARGLTSAVYGANISQPYNIRYYDNTGAERGYLINNYQIGFIDLTFPISDSSPNNTFNISDTEPASNNGNFFRYSFNPNGPFVDNLQISNTTSARVYVQFNDDQSGQRRVTAQLVVSGTNLSTQVSIPYGGNVSIQPWIQPYQFIAHAEFWTDDSAWLSYNLRTGDITYAINNDRRGESKFVTVQGVPDQWLPNLVLTGFEDYNNWVTATRNFPTVARPYTPQASRILVQLANTSGRGTIRIEQYPDASNDWTVKAWCRDPQNGSGYYTIEIYTQIF